MKTYGVIMAGGNGTRLWPLSRQKNPKQLLDLFGTGSLLKQTIQRLGDVIERENILVVGCEDQRELLLEEIHGLIPRENLLLEPLARNTAACIALSCAFLRREKDAVMCVLPADHHIGDVPAFRNVLRRAIHAAENRDIIATIGILPTYAATGYGYLRAGAPSSWADGAYNVDRFVEKPSEEKARKYLSERLYLWNGGIFVSKVDVMLRAIATYLPLVYTGTQRACKALRSGDTEKAREIYSAIPSISIDCGVMEKSTGLLVFPGVFGWSDVGSFDALHAIAPQDENGNAILSGRCLCIDAHGLTVDTNKPVVALGVEDLVVIDMKDVLFLCKSGQSQRMKDVLGQLRASDLNELV